ncbi:MAG: ATP-dependent DNA helicase RecG [Candidatus Omnitrophica bacterium]|nr:ATP-dependent DNA helicase RecG [Candidatus Omnitrophota bacterium]
MKNELKSPDSPVRYVKGIGPQKEKVLQSLGIRCVRDLLYFFPFRYQDRSTARAIRDVRDGEEVLCRGRVRARNLKKIPPFVRRRKVKSIFEAVVDDQTGLLHCVWFNQPYLADYVKTGDDILVFGKIRKAGGTPEIVAPAFEPVKDRALLHVGRIVGLYHLTAKLTHKFMRKVISAALEEYAPRCQDPLPYELRKKYGFPNIVQALEDIHFPGDWNAASGARTRFIFEELFFSQILVYLRKARHKSQPGVSLTADAPFMEQLRAAFGFEFTSSQEAVLKDIREDLGKPYPMHRLLQGDVGCGKTVIAACAMGICVRSGWQAACMVPTEVLAYQHADTLREIFAPFGWKTALLTSSLSRTEARAILDGLAAGEIQVVVGTHALLQETVRFQRLGLTVIDEQHKFGVAQRALLMRKSEVNPHCLVMSATPIPRSLALSFYGDLDLSVIRGRLPGRKIPSTQWYPVGRRRQAYALVSRELRAGRQIYVVNPVIEENREEELASLHTLHRRLGRLFPGAEIALFHGKMAPKEKLRVIKEFSAGKVHILVSTTVIEVGVNVPNATVMLVEHPERFGLAQLHQLRGRVQRSRHQPYFLLAGGRNLPEHALCRLRLMTETSDGFEIAEEDLRLRGPGDFFGFSQHGFPDLRIADPLKDVELLSRARKDAYAAVKRDPSLSAPEHKPIKDHLEFWVRR